MDRLIVISNREPYVHEYNGESIDCSVPTGGVVAAIDPVMQNAKGTWIAWGSGDADKDCSDTKGCVKVPQRILNIHFAGSGLRRKRLMITI